MTDQEFKQKADDIWQAVQKSQNILLHFHRSPDLDSVGSALALGQALKNLGKNVEIIQGDTPNSNLFRSFPNIQLSQSKNLFEINLSDYDLFLILDSSSKDQISRLGEVIFPENLNTVVIDHHENNLQFASVNLIIPTSPATSEIVYDLLAYWNLEINEDIATDILMGIYGDTGGFKYKSTSSHTFQVAANLANKARFFYKYIEIYERSLRPKQLLLLGIAFSSVNLYANNVIAISEISYDTLQNQAISDDDVNSMRSYITEQLRLVSDWGIQISFIEARKNYLTLSFRTRDEQEFNVGAIATKLGGGGHKAAGGATIKMPFDEAKKFLLDTIYSVYPDLKSN